YQEAFGGANLVSVALIRKDGDIYEKEFLATLKQVTDELFFLPGVDRSRVSSLFTPGIRFIEITEDGIASGDVMPADYQPTPEMLETVRRNVARANVIGRIVSEDERGAMIVAELLEHNPVTGEKLDYRQVAHELERIRAKYQTAGIDIHIIGFAKVVGDVTDATLEVVTFFAITLVLTGLLLWLYCGSFKLSLLPLGCSLVAVIWEFGLLRSLGFGIDPFAILVPFLVLSTGVNHGVQMVNSWALEVADNRRDSFRASVATFRRLALPGTAALVTDVSGFATIYLIEIDIIREMALNACLGTAATIVTNKILMPILLTYVRMTDIEGFRVKQLKREAMGDKLWRALSHITDRRWSITVIALCVILLGWSTWKGAELRVGDFKPGVPELKPDSRYNLDSAAIHANFSIGVDLLKVIVESVPEACVRHDVMEKIDRFIWHLQNTEGVESVASLPQLAKLVSAGWNEGSLKWRVLPRNQFSLVQSINPIPISAGLQNPECSSLPVLVFTTDHQSETIQRVLDVTRQFDADNGNHDGWRPPENPDARQNWSAPSAGSAEAAKGPYLRFALASGNVGVMAATNEVIKAKENPILFWVYLT
ncbi:MAG: efflux RND transporter permease subunit, partial [Nevskiales bacterium]